MTSSPSQYQFPPPRDSLFAVHETLPLQPLGLISRGLPWPNGQVHLRPLTVRPGAPLSNLITDRAIFAAKSCVEGNEWAIYLSNCHNLIFQSSLLTLTAILLQPFVPRQLFTFGTGFDTSVSPTGFIANFLATQPCSRWTLILMRTRQVERL